MKAAEKPEIPVPSVREVLEELLQAEEEFEGLQYNPEDEILSVTTDAVELEGVFLGDFEVQLLIPAIGDPNHRSLYQIVALDPHPSLRNDFVTHPHVNDQRLCAGDAGAAIEMALAGGRICDFFMLVRSVLTNYNRDSAYVTLEDWEGTACYDCGSVMGEDDSFYCTSCENEFCGECSSYCHRCEETTCRGCLAPCPVCEESTCNSCLTTCPECGRILCRDCREEEKCPCLDEEPENEEETMTTTQTDPKVQQQPEKAEKSVSSAMSQAPAKPEPPSKPGLKRKETPKPVLRFSPTAWAKLLFFRDRRRQRDRGLRHHEQRRPPPGGRLRHGPPEGHDG